jgi:hypothetical protein
MKNLEERMKMIEQLKATNNMETQLIITENVEKRKEFKEIVKMNNMNIKEERNKKMVPYESELKGSIDPNKGFTMVRKPKNLKVNQGFNHQFYPIKSEYEKIIENQKSDDT